MIFVYLAAIVVFVAIAVTIAVVSKKKEIKRLNKFAKEVPEKAEIVGENDSENDLVIQQEKGLETEKQPAGDDIFEDFSLESDEDEVKKENDDEIDEDLDRKFAEYQKFLRENLNLDDNELDEDMDENDFDPQNFRKQNFEQNKTNLAGRYLPPDMKEVLFSNPLGRESLEQETKDTQDEQENPEN